MPVNHLRCAPSDVLPHARTVESVVVTLPRAFSLAQNELKSNSVLWNVISEWELMEEHCRSDASSPAQSTSESPTGSVDPSTCSPHSFLATDLDLHAHYCTGVICGNIFRNSQHWSLRFIREDTLFPYSLYYYSMRTSCRSVNSRILTVYLYAVRGQQNRCITT